MALFFRKSFNGFLLTFMANKFWWEWWSDGEQLQHSFFVKIKTSEIYQQKWFEMADSSQEKCLSNLQFFHLCWYLLMNVVEFDPLKTICFRVALRKFFYCLSLTLLHDYFCGFILNLRSTGCFYKPDKLTKWQGYFKDLI